MLVTACLTTMVRSFPLRTETMISGAATVQIDTEEEAGGSLSNYLIDDNKNVLNYLVINFQLWRLTSERCVLH